MKWDPRRYLAIWLLSIALLVLSMIVLGGLTRLTGSGLSIVDWKPITGILPPLNASDWTESFQRYQAFPEYQKVNQGMSLSAYKAIFYFEYFHRLLGRLIGMAFILPLIFFIWRRMIPKQQIFSLLLIFILGGLQGVLGWYMVKSGLVHNPHVSQYRLVAHLMTALTLYASLLWIAFGLLRTETTEVLRVSKRLYVALLGFITLIVVMIMTGGFMAGTRAGLAYNTFPLMAGKWLPEHLWTLSPWWLNCFENVTTIQFNHRLLAYLIVIVTLVLVFALSRASLPPSLKRAFWGLLAVILMQVSLGILTVLWSVPIPIAAAHQGGAFIVLAWALYLFRQIKRA